MKLLPPHFHHLNFLIIRHLFKLFDFLVRFSLLAIFAELVGEPSGSNFVFVLETPGVNLIDNFETVSNTIENG